MTTVDTVDSKMPNEKDMSEKQTKKNLEMTVEELLGLEFFSKSSGLKQKVFSKDRSLQLQWIGIVSWINWKRWRETKYVSHCL